MAIQGYTIDGPGVRRLTDLSREFESSRRPENDRGANRQFVPRIIEGILTEDLDATDDPEAPSNALFQIKTPGHLGNKWVNEINPSQVTVLNRTPSSFPSDTIGLAIELYQDKWWFITGGSSIRQVILAEDLMAAVDTRTDPSMARARILRKNSSGDLEFTCKEITIVNRFMHISIDAGTYAKVEWVDGEWQPYAADCSSESYSDCPIESESI